jgi:hypothetical protein
LGFRNKKTGKREQYQGSQMGLEKIAITSES